MGKVVLAAVELGCAEEALTVVAMAATDPVWLTPRHALHLFHVGTLYADNFRLLTLS